MKTKLSTKGQIVLPRAIRRGLSLKAGTELLVSVQGDKIVLVPIRGNSWRKLRGAVRNVSLTRELEKEHAAEKEQEKA